MRLAVLLLVAAPVFAQGQRIERFELRPAADGFRLYAQIEGEDRLISNRATKAWQGWAPHVLIYAERVTQGVLAQRLRWYDSLRRDAHTLATGELLEYRDVVPVRLSTGDYALQISLVDPATKAPWVELATPNGGVFLREEFAAWGIAANDRAQLLRYNIEQVLRTRGDLRVIAPEVTANVSMLPPPTTDATGLYEFASPEKGATLNLRAGGKGLLVVVDEVRKEAPKTVSGAWTQTGAEVRFENMVWVLGVNGLTPKIWNRDEWGPTGLPLRRALGK